MKRKRKSCTSVFFWGGTGPKSKRAKSKYPDDDDDGVIPDDLQFRPYEPEINLLHKRAVDIRRSMPIPFELLMKIFHDLVEISDHPLRDLCCLARVCETWRRIVLSSPSLWSRIDMSSLKITDNNVRSIKKVFDLNESAMNYVKEMSLGGALLIKSDKSFSFLELLIKAPNLEKLTLLNIKSHTRFSLPSLVTRSINSCKKLKDLSIIHSRSLFNNQKWLSDYLVANGKQLETLNLLMSLTDISSQLVRSIGPDFCPVLRVLDLSTCDSLNTRSFDAVQFSHNMPSLEVLRLGSVSFKRVINPPEKFGLKKLRELSMPIAIRDADRDDALFATLTFGSDNMRSLDIRGSSITTSALLDMPSYGIKELHIDDICPMTRQSYRQVILKWATTLEILSLVKINCSETIKSCLDALIETQKQVQLRELDLSSSDVTAQDLKKLLKVAKSLESINLSSCRSLPRGCKGLYSRKPTNLRTQELSSLESKL